MRFILALDRHRSLSAAARALSLSQPALTKALQELETTTAVVLFERHPHGVSPTAAGRLLLGFAERTLTELQRLDDTLNEIASPGGGLVVLGALPVSCAGLVPRIVQRLRLNHGRLELRLVGGRTEELLPKLAAGELDLVLGRLYQPELPDGLVREQLHSEPLSVIARAGHPLFLEEESAAARLPDWDLVLPTFSQRLGVEIEHLLGLLKLSASPRWLRSSSHLFIREILHETDMLTVAPSLLVAGDLIRGSLRVVPIQAAPPERPAGMILNPKRPLSPSAALVCDVIRESVSELIGHGSAAIASGYGKTDSIDASIRKGDA
ncbi:MAG: LysR substrate-binding domain-containing protein [Janthinobacterium lividum]